MRCTCDHVAVDHDDDGPCLYCACPTFTPADDEDVPDDPDPEALE